MRSPEQKELLRAIRRILLADWDPIGIRDEPMARNEYDSYIGGIHHLLRTEASASCVAERLWRIEMELTGLGCETSTLLLPVAEKLLTVYELNENNPD